jgi:hypothetical protein
VLRGRLDLRPAISLRCSTCYDVDTHNMYSAGEVYQITVQGALESYFVSRQGEPWRQSPCLICAQERVAPLRESQSQGSFTKKAGHCKKIGYSIQTGRKLSILTL